MLPLMIWTMVTRYLHKILLNFFVPFDIPFFVLRTMASVLVCFVSFFRVLFRCFLDRLCSLTYDTRN
ncbi:hypothetical protein ZEAMMB73_Zm00001d011421 [Zea mays]|uniref:Uncharacterized protein n=1 Tax=Zea mays TaxID=4577 RepID=A0A1D6FZY4_MAIZE|nr:hypothetical protein ZEAMMB73_Zm00001d011421 [Zea mays]